MKTIDRRQLIGGSLIILGVSILVANLFNTIRLISFAIAVIASLTAWQGVKRKNIFEYLLSLVLFIIAYLTAVFWAVDLPQLLPLVRLGIAFLGVGLLLMSGFIGSRLSNLPDISWLLLPTGLFIALGISFLCSTLSFLDFVLSIGIGLGSTLILWSLFSNYYGMMIAGTLVASHSIGVAVSWQYIDQANDPLARVGIMLLLFALGWASISLMSRYFRNRVAWWPLIPAGVLSVTGWGLFIGGNPASSKMFIGNTGSFALIILGLYVLLLRSGLNRQ